MKEELVTAEHYALCHSVQLWKMVDLSKELTLFTRLVKEKGQEVKLGFDTSQHPIFTKLSSPDHLMSRKLHSGP